MKKILIFLVVLVASVAFATDMPSQEAAGKISKYQGRVIVYDGVSPRGNNVTEEFLNVFFSNKVATKAGSTAVVELLHGDKIALAENALMTIEGKNTYKPEAGKVVFSIKTRGQASGVKIALTSAVIGVKGTQFLVDSTSETCNVYLKEGSIEVDSLEGDFKKYKEVVMDEYEAYVKKMTGEYEDYVKSLEEEFVEYVKSFDMKPGQAISISGNEVKDVKFTEEVNDAFNLLAD